MQDPEMFNFQASRFAIRKCKESTGRVVMYRQHKVTNSFTMEATFSGTKIDQYVWDIATVNALSSLYFTVHMCLVHKWQFNFKNVAIVNESEIVC